MPFIYKGELHKKCVNHKKGSWCATKVNKKREMVDYGFCAEKTKKVNNKKPIVNNANLTANNMNIKKTKKKVSQIKIIIVFLKKLLELENLMLNLLHQNYLII